MTADSLTKDNGAQRFSTFTNLTITCGSDVAYRAVRGRWVLQAGHFCPT